MKLAIAYDFLSHRGGGEKLLLEILNLYQAPLHTVYHEAEKTFPEFSRYEIHTSLLQSPLFKVSKAIRNALLPLGIEDLDFSGYDVVLTVGTWIRGILTQPHTLHIDYCLSPNRRIWDAYQAHRCRMKKAWLGRYNSLFTPVASLMRLWDYHSAQRPDVMFTISHTVRQRIWKYYRRDARVIYPPVDTRGFYHRQSEGYYLTASRLYPEKRIDLIIKAFCKNRLPLKIAGEGPERKHLEKLASDCPNIQFTGYTTPEELKELYAGCEAFVFAAMDEDFGVAPVEANAAGKPVIAIREGGVRETIIEDVSGVFFDAPTPEALNSTIRKAERMEWDEGRIRANARRFDVEVFREEFTKAVEKAITTWRESHGII
jgi:glycosyltransferase involved in cell wall biosynthesis